MIQIHRCCEDCLKLGNISIGEYAIYADKRVVCHDHFEIWLIGAQASSEVWEYYNLEDKTQVKRL